MNALKKKNITNSFDIISKLIRYNLRIIFANKFIYFLIAALIIYILIVVIQLFSSDGDFTDSWIYGLQMFIGILLIFYPTVFGIQNDEDARMLEIIFGIPNYRYKVWLVRLLMIFFITSIILLILSYLSSFALIQIPVFEMVFQLMFPLFFLGCLAFMLSTIVRNGNGTAVVMVIIGVIFLILIDSLEHTKWMIFHNPFDIPRDMNEEIWKATSFQNRLILTIGGIISILWGLINLQKREKFV